MTKEELKTDESKYIIELVIKDKLKKEAEEWLCNNLHSASEEDFIKAMVDIAEPREKRIAELEKENERLTDELKALRESIKDYGAGCYENGLRNGKRKLGEQLTKAKEIIREFVEWATWQGSNCPSFKSIQDKAEQFLKDNEVEK